jgi:hypothetical protein
MHPTRRRDALDPVVHAVERRMTEQIKKSGYLCDCEHKLTFAVLTVWDCQHCGDFHERVTNCACGKCVQSYEKERDLEST